MEQVGVSHGAIEFCSGDVSGWRGSLQPRLTGC